MTDSMLPAPLVPPECDLRDFAFMPLDVSRLRDSDLASDETPEACWAAVLLWCASWHQLPPASIPDSNQWQAKHAGYVSQGRIAPAWAKVRPGALRGWVKCSDGRLYHRVVAEKAVEAWRAKLLQRWKTENARIKKHCQRYGMPFVPQEFEAWLADGCPQGKPLPIPGDKAAVSPGQPKNVPRDKAGLSPGTDGGCPEEVPRETPSKGQGQGQGQGQREEEKGADPGGSGAFAPPGPLGREGFPDPKADLAEAVWALGVPLLTAASVSEPTARKFIGRLRKHNSDTDVLDAMRRCAAQRSGEPVSFLQGCLRVAVMNGADEDARRAAVNAENNAAAKKLLFPATKEVRHA